MPTELNKEQLQRLARLGARARLAELDAERRAILRAFPDLVRPGTQPAASAPGVAPAEAKTVRRRRKRTAAQRKAASERMKKIWAERKKAEA